MLLEHVGDGVARRRPGILDHGGLGGLESAAGLRAQVGAERGRAHHALFPTHAGLHDEVGRAAPVAQHLDVVDLDRARHLHHCLVEEAVGAEPLAREAAEVGQDAHVPAQLPVDEVVALCRYVRHVRSTFERRVGLGTTALPAILADVRPVVCGDTVSNI